MPTCRSAVAWGGVAFRFASLAEPVGLTHTAATRTAAMLAPKALEPGAGFPLSGAATAPSLAAGSDSPAADADTATPSTSPATFSPLRQQHRLHWVNTPVLLEAIERFEQGRLPRSLTLWLSQLLELETPPSAPLRRGC